MDTGYLHIVTGPMFAGKTSQNLTIISEFMKSWIEARKILKKTSGEVDFTARKCHGIFINSTKDIREGSSNGFTTHNPFMVSLTGFLEKISTNDLNTVDVSSYDFISVDEGQFFQGLNEVVRRWVSQGKKVIVSGLSADSNRRKFGEILDLMPFADKVDFVTARCVQCLKETIDSDGPIRHTEAQFTYRTVDDDSQVLVGDEHYYIPVCRPCYSKLKSGKTS